MIVNINSLKALQDYLEALCTKHKYILHNKTDRWGFARLNTEEHIEQIERCGTETICVVGSVNGHRTGAEELKRTRRSITLLFANKASTDGDRGDAVTSAMDKAEKVMFDFVAKMELDMEEFCQFDLDLNAISWEEIEGMWLDNYFGWMLSIPFNGNMMVYDENVWDE